MAVNREGDSDRSLGLIRCSEDAGPRFGVCLELVQRSPPEPRRPDRRALADPGPHETRESARSARRHQLVRDRPPSPPRGRHRRPWVAVALGKRFEATRDSDRALARIGSACQPKRRGTHSTPARTLREGTATRLTASSPIRLWPRPWTASPCARSGQDGRAASSPSRSPASHDHAPSPVRLRSIAPNPRSYRGSNAASAAAGIRMCLEAGKAGLCLAAIRVQALWESDHYA